MITRDNLDGMIGVYSILSHIPIDDEKITGKLFVAGRNVLNQIKEYNVNHLISMIDVSYVPGVKHEIFPINDFNTEECRMALAAVLDTISASIHKSLLEGKNVCVHCAAGISRSPAVVANYLMAYHKIPNPIRYIKNFRHVVRPNPAFRQLLFEKFPILMSMD
jgi:protein-tyrosine phosphatase